MTDTGSQKPRSWMSRSGWMPPGCGRSSSLGKVGVPARHYWGAQTQRSLQHFDIGHDRMPKEVYHAYGYVKKSAAVVNTRAGRLPAWKGQLIGQVCDEVISGALDTSSRCMCSRPVRNRVEHERERGHLQPAHPAGQRHTRLAGAGASQRPCEYGPVVQRHVPTAMHIAAYTMATSKTIPALKRLRDIIDTKAKQWTNVVKIGRTHLEDAVPLTVGQEWSGVFRRPRRYDHRTGARHERTAQAGHGRHGGGNRAERPARVWRGSGGGNRVDDWAGVVTATNKFTAQGTLDRMVRAHAGLKPPPSRCSRSPTTCAGSAPGPAPGSVSCSSPPMSLAARSCQERSTRPRPRPC